MRAFIIIAAMILIAAILKKPEEESPAELMFRVDQAPELCFRYKERSGLGEHMLEIITLSGEKEYVFLFDKNEPKLAVVITPVGGGETTMIDDEANGQIDHFLDSQERPERVLQKEYAKAVKSLRIQVDDCRQPAIVMAG